MKYASNYYPRFYERNVGAECLHVPFLKVPSVYLWGIEIEQNPDASINYVK